MAYFEENKNSNFMEYIEVKKVSGRKDLEEWFSYYRFPFLYNQRGRNRRLWENFEYYFVKLQKKLGIKRDVYFDYKGFAYCHLTHACASYVLQYVSRNKDYMKKIKYCHVGEEFFFQNIIMHSEFADTVVNDSLIYDDWERGRPAFLDERDYESMMRSGKLFARKFGAGSAKLFGMILRGQYAESMPGAEETAGADCICKPLKEGFS